MVNFKGGRVAFSLKSRVRLSENRFSGMRWPLIKLSEFCVIIRSRTWPSSCVDSETRWVNDIDSNKSKKWQAAVLLWSSTQISKLKKRGSRDKMIGSKKSENSSTKPIIVTGLVLKVRSTIYYEKSESWWFGRDEIVGKFKRRSWTKLEFAKNRPNTSLFFFNRVFFFLNVKCQIDGRCRNIFMQHQYQAHYYKCVKHAQWVKVLDNTTHQNV